jgi:hypothetical protein
MGAAAHRRAGLAAATGRAARRLAPTGPGHRPGGLCRAAVSVRPPGARGPAGTLLEDLATFAGAWVVWTGAGWILLVGRDRPRLVAAGGLVSAVGFAVLRRLAAVYLPNLVASNPAADRPAGGGVHAVQLAIDVRIRDRGGYRRRRRAGRGSWSAGPVHPQPETLRSHPARAPPPAGDRIPGGVTLDRRTAQGGGGRGGRHGSPADQRSPRPEALAQRSSPALATAWASWCLGGIGRRPGGRRSESVAALTMACPTYRPPTDLERFKVSNQGGVRSRRGLAADPLGQPLMARTSSVTSVRRSR